MKYLTPFLSKFYTQLTVFTSEMRCLSIHRFSRINTDLENSFLLTIYLFFSFINPC
jgi:hypothetical protein